MSSYSILIVDDEPDNFDVIEALLPSESYKLHYANCGEDALSGLDKFDPDVILLDVMMPGIDGFEVCRRLKLMSQWQAVPIIMVTALASKEDLARCLAAGADDFVNKPVNGLELRARVNSMVRIKKQHDRIQSFSKLQRNNIHSLANNINEIRLDLAIGFPHEFNAPIDTISANIEHLTQNIERLDLDTKLEILAASDRAVGQLRKLTKKFWFYLQLTLETPATDRQDNCTPKSIVEQSAIARFESFPSPIDFDCEIAATNLAVSSEHFQWIVDELFDRIFSNSATYLSLKINGENIDNAFHLSISSCRSLAQGNDLDVEMSKLLQFNPAGTEEEELAIGLKVVKKIVELYDGLFLMSSSSSDGLLVEGQDEITVYLTLPLAPVLAVGGSSASGSHHN
ncbi:response regulator [Chamaesiphon sp. OTE_8_metabat_110]|uniref:response regulator n=1 Tax=Chamaesiphon sp. OTE_8_metabat_110 TaxID=2964696 RepID=UPI00286CA6A9|nr:response regulator [Chamaesiphon sp. OTE_8_metabat_110]